MGKKAQVLIISLWILTILSVLAVSIGRRAGLVLKLSRYQKDKFKALYLAKAGLNCAITQLTNDQTINYDSLEEDNWVNNSEVFKKIMLNENSDEFATVSYTVKENVRDETKFGVIDEERKININTASRNLLIALLEKKGIEAPEDTADNIRIWRGDIADSDEIYKKLGYACKADKFSNIEELNLVAGITPEAYQELKDLITIYGDGYGFININTVSPEVLLIFIRSVAKDLSTGEGFAGTLEEKIIDSRFKGGAFKTKEDIDIALTTEETNIFNTLINKVIFQSDNFLIETIGNVGKIKSKIAAVYNRKDKQLLYWHEN